MVADGLSRLYLPMFTRVQTDCDLSLSGEGGAYDGMPVSDADEEGEVLGEAACSKKTDLNTWQVNLVFAAYTLK